MDLVRTFAAAAPVRSNFPRVKEILFPLCKSFVCLQRLFEAMNLNQQLHLRGNCCMLSRKTIKDLTYQ